MPLKDKYKGKGKKEQCCNPEEVFECKGCDSKESSMKKAMKRVMSKK